MNAAAPRDPSRYSERSTFKPSADGRGPAPFDSPLPGGWKVVMAKAELGGITVLLVEDEGMQAMDLQLALEDAGASVIGPVEHVDDAWDLIDLPQLDCAVLDVNLHGEMIFPVADALLEYDVPVIFVTALADQQLPQRYRGLPIFHKPLSPEPLTRTIKRELTKRH